MLIDLFKDLHIIVCITFLWNENLSGASRAQAHIQYDILVIYLVVEFTAFNMEGYRYLIVMQNTQQGVYVIQSTTRTFQLACKIPRAVFLPMCTFLISCAHFLNNNNNHSPGASVYTCQGPRASVLERHIRRVFSLPWRRLRFPRLLISVLPCVSRLAGPSFVGSLVCLRYVLRQRFLSASCGCLSRLQSRPLR